MFFQSTTGSESANKANADLAAAKSSTALLKEEIQNLLNPLENIKKSFDTLVSGAEGLNKLFIGNRSSIQGTMTELANLIPMVTELGGSLEDAQKLLFEVAAGSRRQVIATSEEARELFATGKLIGKGVSEIVDDFAKVGIQSRNIGETIGKSIAYVQSIGANAKTVMADVEKNVSQLSRYNFNGGVEGLTKMAAQASLLRFDMSETFKLADDVLDPDRAVQVASAFQRLGVAAGNLVDPFQLMNQSINDPSGLQDSLINMSKQFTYFDEKTKSYKINPQGILTLREIGKETGVSAEKLREAALSAADFDERLSAVGKSRFAIDASEDDKKLLANMARMGKGGAYEVMVKDPDKGIIAKKLEDLNKEEFDKLIEEQKSGPKTVEEIQKNQLDIAELSLAQLRTMNATIGLAVAGGPTTISQVTSMINKGFRGFAKDTSEDLSDTVKEVKKDSLGMMEKLKTATTDAEREKILEEFGEGVGANIKDLLGQFLGNVEGITRESPLLKKTTDFLKNELPKNLRASEKDTGKQNLKAPSRTTSQNINSDVFKRQTEIQRRLAEEKSITQTEPRQGNLDVSGKITIEVMGKDLELSGPVTKALLNATSTLEEKIYSMVENQAKIKGIKFGK
jgi:hypothetical protein